MTANFAPNWADIQPRTLEEIERELSPLLSAEESSVRQAQHFEDAFSQIRAWLATPEADRPNAPAFMMGFPAGNGKTDTAEDKAIEEAEADPDLRILMLVDSLKSAEERAAEYRKKGFSRVRVVRGRSQPVSKDSEERMCAKADTAAMLSMKGLAVGSNLCKGKDASGQDAQCEFYATCPYILQMQEAKTGGIMIASHQYLNIALDGLKGVDIVIIDETFIQAMAAERKVDLDRFNAERTVGESFHRNKGESPAAYEMRRLEESADFVVWISKFRRVVSDALTRKEQPIVAAFKAAEFTPELCRHLAVLEYSNFDKCDIHPGLLHAEQIARISRAKMQEANAFGRVWKILADELEAAEADPRRADLPPHGLTFEKDVFDTEAGVQRSQIVCNWSRESILKDVPTVMLDANAGRRVTERFYPETDFRTMRVAWKNVRTTVIQNRTGSKKMFAQERRQAELRELIRMMNYRLWKFTGGVGNPADMIGVISHKATIEALKNMGVQCNHMGYFGNIRGTNAFKHCRLIIVAGRSEPSVKAIESLARSIYYKDPEPLTFIKPNDKGEFFYPKRKQIVRASNGQTMEVEVSYHPDPRVNELLEMAREGEISQAAARGRFIHNDEFTELLIMSNVPCADVPVDRFADWDQVAPDRFDIMGLKGIIHEKSEDVAAANPELFASAAAVRQAWKRRPNKIEFFGGMGAGDCDTFVYNTPNTDVSQRGLMVRVTYERPGKDGELRSGGASVRRVRNDETAEEVARRVAEDLKDVVDLDVTMPEPPAAEIAPSEAPAAPQEAATIAAPAVLPPSYLTAKRFHRASGIRYVTRAALLLAYATGERPFWMEPRQNNSSVVRVLNPANTNGIHSGFEASPQTASL